MFGKSEPFEITCDAPSYLIVKACEKLGFHDPMDVRWCRLSHYLTENGEHQGGTFPLWGWLAPTTRKGQACSCHEPLPVLDWYTFTFSSGQVACFRLGQCRRCRAIYWEED